MDIVGIISAATSDDLDELYAVISEESLRRYEIPCRIVRRSPDSILFASPSAGVIDHGSMSLAIAGYTTSSNDEIVRILQSELPRTGSQEESSRPVRISDSLGGTHCIAMIGEIGGAIWGSVPGCSPPYFTSNDRYTVASSRPGLLKTTFGLGINEEYWRWIATIGYPINDSAPYDGVRCVLGGTALRTLRGSGRVVEYVLPKHGDLPQTPDAVAAAEDAVHTELLRATSAVRQFKSVEFRLSGGKDSRMVASALSALGLKCTAYTKGAREGQIPAAIASAAGLPHVNLLVVDAPVAAPADLVDRGVASQRRTDGLVSLHGDLALDLPEASTPGRDAWLQGQIELHKGGYAKGRAKFEHAEAVERLERFVIPAHVKDRAEYARKLADRFDLSAYATPLDVLYFPYAGTRASRHLEVSYREISRQCTPIYPPNDERMFLAVSNVDRRRRATERMMFDLIKRNSPQMASIPVFGDTWRFQNARPESGKEESMSRNTIDRSIGGMPWARRFMCNSIRSNSNIMSVARESIREDFLYAIGLSDHQPTDGTSGFKRTLRLKVLMRLFVTAVAADNWETI